MTIALKEIHIANKKSINKREKNEEEVKLDKKNIKKFIEKWEKGMTGSEIISELKKGNLSLKNEKKKRFNLNK